MSCLREIFIHIITLWKMRKRKENLQVWKILSHIVIYSHQRGVMLDSNFLRTVIQRLPLFGVDLKKEDLKLDKATEKKIKLCIDGIIKTEFNKLKFFNLLPAMLLVRQRPAIRICERKGAKTTRQTGKETNNNVQARRCLKMPDESLLMELLEQSGNFKKSGRICTNLPNVIYLPHRKKR